MPPKGNKENLIRVRVDDRLKREAEQMAEDRGESLSVILRHLLRDAIRDWRQEISDTIENDPAHIAHKANQLLDSLLLTDSQSPTVPAKNRTRYDAESGPSPSLNDEPPPPEKD